MSALGRGMFRYLQEKTALPLQEERNLLEMLFMLHQTCIIISKEKTADTIARGEEPT
jgi:hypothetical protein